MSSRRTSSHAPAAPTIAVVGGGIMGALTALTAAHLGINVAWIGPAEQGRTDGADARNYALSPLTVDLLKQIGVWPAVAPLSCTVSRMEVFSGKARIDLSATDAGAEFLSVMVLHRDLLSALEQAVQFRPQIQRITARPDQISVTKDQVTLTAGGQTCTAQLVVGADGARSWVRSQTGILWGQRDYAQQGVVATFQTEYPHGGVATQWFDQGEILALLPLADSHQLSMVWSTSRPEPTSAAVMDEFVAGIQERSQGRFGKLTLVGDAVSAPLRMMITEQQSALRTVLVGDAAHTVHPLAGYGLNLGVQDLLSLEALWKEHRHDPGSTIAIHAYEKSRRFRVKRVQWGLDVLQRLVTQSHPALSRLREFGMRLVADIGPLRQFLIKQAISPQ
ncbi:MAG: ubiquinone biosynthesis protein UbiH [Burkholderiaceae bacterium]|nr:ubiquinone biosynthesis protein UbiH [Burkholderiaceae bacterium]